ncbi:MAG: L,D-transpeptidase family protein [Hyphomicrobiaceae bacterium]|nr:L,D-transpeptidase family protein [Hyphomicrobiaceae bacterium]
MFDVSKMQDRLNFGKRQTGRGLAVLAASALAITALVAPTQGTAESSRWWEKKRDLSLQERRSRRQQFSDAMTARLGPAYQTNIPFVSQQSIDGLSQAIARYRQIVASGGWRTFPDGMTIRPNDRGNHVAELRRHLQLTGDLPVQQKQRRRRARSFDASLQEAVARFQMRHGLRVTGFVDTRTKRALNVPAQQRLRQLETNMVRLQDLMKVNKAGRYVLVNVPAYTLQAVQGGTLGLQSRVVVGKPSRATPNVSAKIKELNFFPYWRVPDSIAHKDLIPHMRKDPTYFAKENFSVLPGWGAKPIPLEQVDWFSPKAYKYKFRQDPGHNNALGVVRINMPNKHIVYLHDTPLKQLFSQNSRAFSSGCVRVERVLDLASWLLEGTKDWSPMRVNVTIGLGKSETVKLKKSVPVHFVYVTAWSNGNGVVHFRPDIYGQDGSSSVRVADADDAPIPGSSAITP